MTSLYVLANEYRAVANTLEDMDLPAESIRDTLEGLAGDLEAKAANVAMVVRNLETTVFAITEAIEEMQRRREALENRADYIKEYILENMITSGIKVISCPHFVLKTRNNPPSVEIYNAYFVPRTYINPPQPMPKSLNKRMLLEDMKNGVDIPGARLIKKQRLVIK